jgi:hypothetical protein
MPLDLNFHKDIARFDLFLLNYLKFAEIFRLTGSTVVVYWLASALYFAESFHYPTMW